MAKRMCAEDRAVLRRTRSGITEQQEAFCEAYLEQPYPRSKRAAYEKAYGKIEEKSGAKVTEMYKSIDYLMNLPKVKARMAELEDVFVVKHMATKDRVVAGFWKIYERCMQSAEVVDRHGEPVTQEVEVKLSDGTTEKIQAAVYKFDAAGAANALTNLGRYLGIFNADTTERDNINIAVGVDMGSVRNLITAEMSKLHKTIDTEITECPTARGGKPTDPPPCLPAAGAES